MKRSFLYLLAAGVSAFLFGAGCGGKISHSAMQNRDINQVLAAHQDELMGIPGVIGVFVGLAEDEKTECIRVLLRAANPEAEKRIPKSLDGFRVITEVTGEIRPLAR